MQLLEVEADRLFGGIDVGPVDLAHAALVCIDLQYVQHPDYGLAAYGRSLGLAELADYYSKAILEACTMVRETQDVCRELGVPVVHVRVASLTNDARDAFSLTRVVDFPQIKGEDHFESQIIDAVGPRGDEVIITKLSSGAFNASPLDDLLRNLRIVDLICCGVVTNGCVESTVRGAVDRGYRVHLVSDGVSAWTPEGHEQSLRAMGRFFARIIRASELCAELRRLAK